MGGRGAAFGGTQQYRSHRGRRGARADHLGHRGRSGQPARGHHRQGHRRNDPLDEVHDRDRRQRFPRRQRAGMSAGGRRLHGKHVDAGGVGLRRLVGRRHRLNHNAFGLLQSGDHATRRYPEGE